MNEARFFYPSRAEAVKRGEFREDPYYRPNAVGVFLPDLRERREDIPLLVDGQIVRRTSNSSSETRGRAMTSAPLNPQSITRKRKARIGVGIMWHVDCDALNISPHFK